MSACFTDSYVTGTLPVSFTRFEGGAPPPSYDVASALVPDLRPVLAHLGRSTHHGDDRLAGFVRVDVAGPPRPLSRVEVVGVLVEVLERLERDVRSIREESDSGTDVTGLNVARALRALRDTVARRSRSAGTLLSDLADALQDEDLADVQEDAAEGFVLALPRERLKRSDVSRLYRAAGSPGGLGRNALLALVRDLYGDHVERRSGRDGVVFDLRHVDAPAPGATSDPLRRSRYPVGLRSGR